MNKKKLRILFRTSGGRAPGKQLGLGHIYRCVNLASFLKRNKLFFLIEDYGEVEKILKNNGFHKIIKIKNESSLANDITKTVYEVKRNSIDIVIVDKFNVKKRYLNEIRKYTKVVLISDLSRYQYPADLIINGFIGFKNKILVNKYHTKCLLGPRFQILNKNFAKKNLKRQKKYHILATFGGYDEKNIIRLFLEELLEYQDKIKTKIILGPATTKSKEIKKLQTQFGTNLDIVDQTENMQKEIANAEFGICSGGITTYEFAAMKTFFAIICQVNHQQQTAKVWHQKGLALNLGLVNKNLKKKIRSFLESIMEEKSYEIKQSVVDGSGGQRVAQEISKLI